MNESSKMSVRPSILCIQIQSRELYTNFVREEIELQGLPVPDVPVLVSPDFFKRFFSFFY